MTLWMKRLSSDTPHLGDRRFRFPHPFRLLAIITIVKRDATAVSKKPSNPLYCAQFAHQYH